MKHFLLKLEVEKLIGLCTSSPSQLGWCGKKKGTNMCNLFIVCLGAIVMRRSIRRFNIYSQETPRHLNFKRLVYSNLFKLPPHRSKIVVQIPHPSAGFDVHFFCNRWNQRQWLSTDWLYLPLNTSIFKDMTLVFRWKDLTLPVQDWLTSTPSRARTTVKYPYVEASNWSAHNSNIRLNLFMVRRIGEDNLIWIRIKRQQRQGMK